MAQFDPALKTETWLFEKVGEQGGQAVYQRLKFNYVSYDGSPDRDIEPVNFAGELKDGGQVDLLDPARNSIERPRVVKFEFMGGHNGNPFSGIVGFD